MNQSLETERDFKKIVSQSLKDVPFDALLLYGSTARNEDTPESDIDILLVSKNADFEKWTSAVAEAEQHLGRYIGRPVHIIATDWPTAKEQRRQFWQEVRRDGRVLAGQRAKDLING